MGKYFLLITIFNDKNKLKQEFITKKTVFKLYSIDCVFFYLIFFIKKSFNSFKWLCKFLIKVIVSFKNLFLLQNNLLL